MQLEHVKGNTYYINFPSIIGVYIFPDETCLLIDSGASSAFASKAHKLLRSKNLKVVAIFNTHAHADHSGGNSYFQKESNCDIYATSFEAAFMENSLLGPYCLWTASPVNMLRNKFLMPEASVINHKIKPGRIFINDEIFEVVDLPGHSMEHVGIVTPDEVFFSGDSLISLHNLEKFPFLYMADVEKHIRTLEKLKDFDYPYTVFSHGGLMSDVKNVVVENRKVLKHILTLIEDYIKTEKSREEIVSHVIKEMNLPDNRNQYILIAGTISAYLSYLCNTKKARIFTDDNNLKVILSDK
ncbi:MBL fold metallo-hydrolase [Thermosyntropha sp.]|uniref:MBL fold metallo-hydrolase n=1 Tax=Thermosyntropha sp. TaxID=2740820 RepID=UPI0025E93E65|nr:MBL fold metallo-hydrolase [Thermosyntropha sp.]MBO8159827.1 MBL fold metallo-hydrolase [Thermosyntropha sp.]